MNVNVSGMFSSNTAQNRHPERSAVTDLSRNTELGGAESKDPGGAHLTDTAPTLSKTEIGEHDLAEALN